MRFHTIILSEANVIKDPIELIKEYKRISNQSYTEIGKLLNVDRITVYNWIRGKYKPSPMAADLIRRVIGSKIASNGMASSLVGRDMTKQTRKNPVDQSTSYSTDEVIKKIERLQKDTNRLMFKYREINLIISIHFLDKGKNIDLFTSGFEKFKCGFAITKLAKEIGDFNRLVDKSDKKNLKEYEQAKKD